MPNGPEAMGAVTEPLTVSKYNKHHKTLLPDDAEEGWASELHWYLKTMQRDMKKDTDIVGWWQVSSPWVKTSLFWH